MAFQKEHDLASEYFSSMDSNLCFHHLVGTEGFWYFVSFKRDDVNFNGDKEKKKLNKLINEKDFASEGWEPFKYRIEKALSWSDYGFGLVIFSKRSLTSVVSNF